VIDEGILEFRLVGRGTACQHTDRLARILVELACLASPPGLLQG